MNIPSYGLTGLLCIGTLALLPARSSAQLTEDCAATAENLAFWQEVYNNREDTRIVADALSYDLLPCLGAANSELRDTYGYGLYTYWLRSDRLSVETRTFLLHTLTDNLKASNSLLRSFSALILSELLRADAMDPFIPAAARAVLFDATRVALAAENDYRGLDAELGWVHPIAHMADVLWRLALHPAFSAIEARGILQLVRTQAATDEAAFRNNEGDRLARVIAVLIRTEVLGEQEIVTWLTGFELRLDGEAWGTVFASTAGMTELHNTKLLVRALSDQLEGVELHATITTTL
ncbi:MAG: DUF2785 domain-containing protein, partial [Pseudohongiellaceae bacterium]